MPNPNHDAKGQFASGESAGAGMSSHDQGHQDLHNQTVALPLARVAAASDLAQAQLDHAQAQGASQRLGHRDLTAAQKEAQARSTLQRAQQRATEAGVTADDLRQQFVRRADRLSLGK